MVSSFTAKRGAVSIGPPAADTLWPWPPVSDAPKPSMSSVPGSRSTQAAFTDGESTAPPESTTVSGVDVGRRVEPVERLDQRTGERVADDHEEGDLLALDEAARAARGRGGGRGR